MIAAKAFIGLCAFWAFLAFVAAVDVIRKARNQPSAIDPEHD